MTTPRLELNCFPSMVRNSLDATLSGSSSFPLPGSELTVVAVAEEDARPDNGVEDDVVLPHEVRVLGRGVLPPLAPRVRLPSVRRPLDRGGQVADHRVEPDIDPLVVLLLVTRDGDRNAPVEVTRDRSWLQLLHEVERETLDVRPPVVVRLDPGGQLLLEGREVEEEVLRVPENRRRTVDTGPGIDEVGGIELVPAVVALVAPRALEATDRAGALDIPVGQSVSGRGGERAKRLLLDDVALGVERAEQITGDAIVVSRRDPREQVVGDPEVAQVLPDEAAEALRSVTRRLAGVVRRHHDGRPVLVRAADHEHVVAAQPVVARERVRGNAESRHVADVPGPIRVGPCDRNQDLPRRARSVRSAHREG